MGFYKIKIKPFGYDEPINVVGYWVNSIQDCAGGKTSSFFDCSNFCDDLAMVFEQDCLEINENMIC